MRRHCLKEHRYQPYADASQTSKFVVKVNHIPAGSITKYELMRDREGRELAYSTFNLVPGKNGSDDFGYINFDKEEDANYAVREWDGRIIHGKRVSALLQRSGSDATPSVVTPRLKSTSSSSKDLKKKTASTVKVMIGDGGQLTGNDLESYFGRFGKIEAKPFICNGTPDYAYINYENVQSVTDACREGKFQIKGTTVLSVKPASAQVLKNIDCERIRCDSLVAKHFVSNRGIQEFIEKNQATINLGEGGFEIWAEKQSLVAMLNFVMKEMKSLKKQMAETVLTPHCYHLPTLCDSQTIETLTKLEEKHLFSLEILDQSQTRPVTLQELQKRLCRPFAVPGHAYLPTVADRNIKNFLVSDCDGTEHQWQWETDNGTYMPYHQDLCSEFNQQIQLSPGSTQFRHKIGSHTYAIDFSTFTQTNLHTKKQRKIRRMPSEALVGPKCHIKVRIRARRVDLSSRVKEVLKELERDIEVRSLPLPENSDETFKQQLSKKTNEKFVQCQFLTTNKKEVLQIEGASSYIEAVVKELREHMAKIAMQKAQPQLATTVYPTMWEPQDEDIELKEVKSNEEERKSIETLIHKTMSNARILSVQRIQNKWLWQRHCFAKQRMSDKNNGVVNEKELFHGTNSTPPEKIYKSEQGFDFRYSSMGMWGTGTYFAVNASYSNSYAFQSGRNKQMILAKVLTGETVHCPPDNALKKPPRKILWMKAQCGTESKFEDELYDSVSGHTIGSDIFVIYDHEKAYPAYLIQYQDNGY